MKEFVGSVSEKLISNSKADSGRMYLLLHFNEY